MIEWACIACHEPQVGLGLQEPPASRLCHTCRAERDRPTLAQRLAGAGVPSAFRRHATREAWMEHFHRQTFNVGDWPGEGEKWLCLWGPTGTGKTSAATVLLAEHLERGGRGLWIDGMTLLDELAREMDVDGERTILPRLLRTPFLVLDEPFSGYLTDYAAGRMLLLIRRRDQDDTRTIVTSQLDPEALLRLGASPKYPTGSQPAWRRIIKAARVLAAAPIYVDDTAGLTITQLDGRVRRACEEQGLALAIVDYLQLLSGKAGQRPENRNLEVAQISKALKELGKSVRVPVIALSQLSREVTKRSGFRPSLADLRDSGAIEADADLVAFVHREHAYNPEAPPNAAEIIVAKNRHGATGSAHLIWISDTTTFRNASPEEARAIAAAVNAGLSGEEELF